MSAQVDFLALYRELGIDPGCAPEAFKRAYRRRVSELHPDRGAEGVGGEEVLKSLNLGYAAALEFFQAHGRFPGAPAGPARPRLAPAVAPAPGPAPAQEPAQAPEEPADRAEGLGQRRWLSLLLVALALLVVGSQLGGRDDDPDVPEQAAGEQAPPRRAPTSAPMAAALELGLSAESVLARLGAPTDTANGGRLWHYGPSWIRLSCRRVVDWYSSPLMPLGLSSMHSGAGLDGPVEAGACAELDPATQRAY